MPEIYTYNGAVIVVNGAVAASQSCCCGICCRPICNASGIFNCADFSSISGKATGFYSCTGGGESIFVDGVLFGTQIGGSGNLDIENIQIAGTKNGLAGGSPTFNTGFPSGSGDWYTIYVKRWGTKADQSQAEQCGEPPNTYTCYPTDGYVSVELRYYECTEEGLVDKTKEAFVEDDLSFNDVAGAHVSDLNYWYCGTINGGENIGTTHKYDFKVNIPADVNIETPGGECEASSDTGPFEMSPVWPTDGIYTNIEYYCDSTIGQSGCLNGPTGSGNPVGQWVPGVTCLTYNCNQLSEE